MLDSMSELRRELAVFKTMNQRRSVEFQPRTLPLAAWSRGHALTTMLTLGVCVWLRLAWPLAVSAGLAFAGLVLLGRGAFTPSGRFGLANIVTSARLLVLLTLALPPRRLPGGGALTITLLVLGLDLIDGFVARRRN